MYFKIIWGKMRFLISSLGVELTRLLSTASIFVVFIEIYGSPEKFKMEAFLNAFKAKMHSILCLVLNLTGAVGCL